MLRSDPRPTPLRSRSRAVALVAFLLLLGTAPWAAGRAEGTRGGPAHRAAGARPAACGVQPGSVGLSYRADPLLDAGRPRVRIRATVSNAPVDPLVLEPVAFLDDALAAVGAPLPLPCATPVERTLDLAAAPAFGVAGRTLTLIFRPRPWVPATVASLGFEEALARYDGRPPPGATTTPANLVLRWPGSRPQRERVRLERRIRAARADRVAAERPARSFLFVPGPDGASVSARPAHFLRLGATVRNVRFGVHLDPPRALPGAVAVACFFDAAPIAAFASPDGDRRLRTWLGRVEPGTALRIDARLDLAGARPDPGWHRLGCLAWTNLLGRALDPAPLAIEGTYVFVAP